LAVGTFLFVLIALVALGLAHFVEWLGRHGMPTALLQVMTFMEYALLGVDVIAFSIFLYTMLAELVRALIWRR